jgi:hypothetical protein
MKIKPSTGSCNQGYVNGHGYFSRCYKTSFLTALYCTPGAQGRVSTPARLRKPFTIFVLFAGTDLGCS